ncbi:MAG: hypothetical protein HY651_09325 [Acidobacteria bacterium]|nr:hypothetical protein [Acidobacteriota bacterium]
MKSKKRAGRPAGVRIVRSSISFPADVHKNLSQIARQKKVSFGWVVREAAEKYLADKWPLFAEQEK